MSSSYRCMRCGNTEGFFSSSIGMCCEKCLSYEVVMGDSPVQDHVYIPDDQFVQVKELERVYKLTDYREEGGPYEIAA